MALFIIYTDLSKDNQAWKDTLQNILNFKHQVCIVTNNSGITQQSLSAMKNLSAIRVLEMKEDSCNERQLEEAKKLTEFVKKDIIIAVPNKANLDNISDKIPKENIVIINGNREDPYYYKKPGTKDHFEKLIQLSSTSTSRHSNSEEFEEIHSMLVRNRMDLKQEWPITPRDNLLAEKDFLTSVLNHADKFPGRSCEQCLLEVEADFAAKNKLAAVVGSSPNYPILNWGMFSSVLNFNTSTGDLLQKVKNRLAEKNKEVNQSAQQEQIPAATSRPGYTSYQQSK